MTVAPFRGFDRSAMQFWHELAAEMSREWFAANKQRYEEQWVAPLTAVMREVARRLAPAYRPLAIGEPGVLRIHRDLRFSTDRTPYKTHIAAVIRFAGQPVAQVGHAVLYVEIGIDEEYVGAGCYQFDAARRVRWRKAIAGAPGAALVPIMARLRKAGFRVGGHDHYKRLPSGFPAAHPRAELLKYKGLTCAFPEIPAGLLHLPRFSGWLIERAKATVPLMKWLHRHVR